MRDAGVGGGGGGVAKGLHSVGEAVAACLQGRFPSCGHLVLEWFRLRFGWDLEEPAVVGVCAQRMFAFYFPRCTVGLGECEDGVRTGDMALFRSGRTAHVGVVVRRGAVLWLLHCGTGGGAPVLERLSVVRGRLRFSGFFRAERGADAVFGVGGEEVVPARDFVTGALLLIALIGVIAGVDYLIDALTPDVPEFDGDGPGRSDNYSFSGANNRLRLWRPLQLPFGIYRQYPDLGSFPYSEFDDDGNEYRKMVLNAGLGDLQAGDLYIGKTPAADFYGVGFANLEGGLLGSSANLDIDYLATVPGGVNFFGNIVIPGFAFFDIYNDGTHLLHLDEGLLVYVNSVAVNWSTSPVTLTGLAKGDYVTLSNSAHADKKARLEFAEGLDLGVEESVFVEEGVKIANGTEAATGQWITRVLPAAGGERVLVNLSARLYKLNDSGDYETQTSVFEVEWRGVGETAWVGVVAAVDGSLPAGVSTSGTNRFSCSHDSDKFFRRTVVLDLAGRGGEDVEVRVRRIGVDSDDNKVFDEMSVHSFVMVFPNTAYQAGQHLFAFAARADNDLNGRIDKINHLTYARAPVWRAGAWTAAAERTTNPAAWFRWFCLGGRDAAGEVLFGLGLAAADLDEEGLGAWFAFCDGVGLECNGILDSDLTCDAVLRRVAAAGRAHASWASGRLGVWVEAPWEVVAAVLTEDDVVAGSLRVTPAVRRNFDGVALNYRDAGAEYQQRTLRVAVPGVAAPGRFSRSDAWGVTAVGVAQEEAELRAAKMGVGGASVKFRVSALRLGLSVGDVVTLRHRDFGGEAARRWRVRSLRFEGEAAISVTAEVDSDALFAAYLPAADAGQVLTAAGDFIVMDGGRGVLTVPDVVRNFVLVGGRRLRLDAAGEGRFVFA